MSKKKPPRATRGGTEVWLIGSIVNDDVSLPMTGRLPTTREVFKTMLANIRSSPGVGSAEAAAKETASQLIRLWEKASIPTRNHFSVARQLKALHKKYNGLLKDRHLSGAVKKPGSKLGQTHEKKREEFVNSLNFLFDIGHKDALDIMTIEEDKAFYKSMQTDRKAFMLGLDRTYNDNQKKIAEKARRALARKQLEIVRKRNSEREKNELLATRQLSGLSAVSTDGTSTAEDTDDEFKPNSKKIRVDVLKSQLVTSALARTSTSSYAGSMIVKAAVQAAVSELSVDEKDVKIVCSSTSVKRKSGENNKDLADLIKQEFEPNCKLVVHFDGKLFPSNEDGDVKADRLPVVVSGKGTEKLLGIPELAHGSGECIATAVVTLLTEWELQEHIIGLVFDTTSTNSGRWGGACVLIQQKLSMDLLELACRHHVLELVLGAVFDALFGVSKKPDFMFVDLLKNAWKKLNTNVYRTAASSRGVSKLIPNTDEIIQFCSSQLEKRQPRGDYRELLELTIIFLGGSVPGKAEYSFKAPGASSKTRWMAKALYAFKIWMFGKQLKLDTAQSDSFLKMCIFISMYYVKHWYECPDAVKAPANDLQLLQSLSLRKESHIQAAFSKLTNHLWYLSETLVCLALFDDRVPLQEKRTIVTSIQSKQGPVDLMPRGILPPNKIVASLKLSDFASKNSLKFFTITQISTDFLVKDPADWSQDPTYCHGLELVKNIIPVNDIAERGVSLMKKYMTGNKLTHNESQRQYMLQAVEKHRAMYDRFGTKKK